MIQYSVGRLPHLRSIIVALATSAIALPALAEGPVQVPGTTVTMTPPAGYIPAKDFSGFANVEKQGSFLIAELPPAALGPLTALFTDTDKAKADFAKKGITIESSDDVTSASGAPVPLLFGTQTAHGMELTKVMALYGGEKTVMITFQVPKENAPDEDAIKAAFASVSTGAAPAVPDQMSSLPFEIEAVAPFRIVQTLAGASVLMTVGDKDADPEGKQPLAIAALSNSTAPAGSVLTASAEAALKSTPNFSAAKIENREETTFANNDGIVLTGTLEDKGIAKRFYQAFAVHEDGRVMRYLAYASADDYEKLKDSIEEIAGSISFRD